MKKVQFRKELKIDENDFSELEIDLNILQSRVLTEDRKLIVIMEIELEDYQRLHDSAVVARPRYLQILGVLCFFIDYPLIPMQNSFTSYNQESVEFTSQEKFIVNGNNYIEYLNSFKNSVFVKKSVDESLIFSLLDRWRKAYYLEDEGQESLIYEDEVLLSYFHILELSTTAYYKELKKIGIDKIDEFTKSFLEDVFFLRENKLEDEFRQKKKLLEGLLFEYFPIKSKIYFLLNKQGMLTDRLGSFIETMVSHRNDIAHGRHVFKERIVYPPISQFFPVAVDRRYGNDILRYLTAKIIAGILNIDFYDEIWNSQEIDLLPSKLEMRGLIKKESFKDISFIDFENGLINGITSGTIVECVYSKIIKPKEAKKIVQDLIINFSGTDEELLGLIDLAIILVDQPGNDENFIEHCKVLIIQFKTYIDGDFSDIIYHLESRGYTVPTLKEMM